MWLMGYHIYLIRTGESANVSQNQIVKESFHSMRKSLKLALFSVVK